MSARSPEILQAECSRLVIVDVQEKLLPLMPDVPALIAACRTLIAGANLFSVPISATEQYPKGLGPTTPELTDVLPERIAKLEFSCCGVLNWPAAAEDTSGRYQIVLAGMETHVCILQTALELQALGYRVFVVADAVSSRREIDKQIAFQRLQSAGVTLITVESVLFEWCERCDHPQFKGLSQLIKARAI